MQSLPSFGMEFMAWPPESLALADCPIIFGIRYDFFLAHSKKCLGEIFCRSKSLWPSQFIWLSEWLPKLTSKKFIRIRARAIQISLVPIYFVAKKFGRHPECFGQMSGLQSINQESCTTSIWLNPEIVWAKYFAKAKACGHLNPFGQVNGSQINFKELWKGSCQGHPIFFGADMFCKSDSWSAPRKLWASG